MADQQNQNPWEAFLATLLAEVAALAPQVLLSAIFKHAQSTPQVTPQTEVASADSVQPLTEKTPAQKNCESQHAGQAGYCDSSGTWHPSN